MNTPTESAVREAVESYVDPYLGLELRAAGALRGLQLDAERLQVTLALGFPARRYRDELAAAIEQRVRPLAGSRRIGVEVEWQVAAHTAAGKQRPVQGIRNIIAVASGKGGVGKSTTAANLALGLAHEGAAVGLLDADVYGPSQPLMMGLAGQRPTSPDQRTMIAPEAYGIKVMSIGFLIDAEQPMVWRGPMVTQALVQLLETTRWGELDYLIVDMPPGTGDTQLTLTQRVPVSGAVIVTTPQDIALLDARKGLRMFQEVKVPVLGIVENMSTHVCSNCGHEEHIFGAGGGRRMAEQYDVELLAELPLDIRIREQADGGRPTVVAEPDSNLGRAYIDLARRTAARLVRIALEPGVAFPSITMEDT
ncbi:MAG TPA: iron-sulfur cluster carrier protein ApbC [Steroidobacteraceae bacterium]|jgi:ATP-binding protein involved in chromosome partitioning|nr:iron-sulfur cluster carrier protein ApbC [Steroidobacteraceae bacterium]